MYLNPSIYLSIHLSIYQSINPSIYLSISMKGRGRKDRTVSLGGGAGKGAGRRCGEGSGAAARKWERVSERGRGRAGPIRYLRAIAAAPLLETRCCYVWTIGSMLAVARDIWGRYKYGGSGSRPSGRRYYYNLSAGFGGDH